MKACPCFPLVLPVILGRGPSAAAFHTASIAIFCLAVKGQKSPPPRQQRGRAIIRLIHLCFLLPLALVGLPPRRERRVFWGEGGGAAVVIYQAGNIPVLCLAKATEIDTTQR